MPDGPEVDVVEHHRTTIRKRNQREWAAAAIVALIFGARVAMAPSTAERIGSAIVVAGAVVVAGVLWLQGRVRVPPGPAGDVFRHELRRQGTLLRWAPAWYCGPFLAGWIVLYGDRPVMLLAGVIVLGLIGGLNVMAGNQLLARAHRGADAVAPGRRPRR